VRTIVVIGNDAERQVFTVRADWDATWVLRSGGQAGDAELLQAAVASCGPLPKGDGYVWIAAEARAARKLRTYVSETLGHPKAWMKASGYWMTGQADMHVSLDD
jgi:NADPH-dependent ferric siderophore reductase